MINVSEFIKTKRRELGITQGELAARANVHQPYISRLEADAGESVTLDVLERVLNGLGYTAVVEPEKWPENGKGEA